VIIEAGAPGTEPSKSGSAAAELAELFFAAKSAERRLILLNFDTAASSTLKVLTTIDAIGAMQRLEHAALRVNHAAFTRELVLALGISYAQARRVASDPSGEALVVTAKALNAPADLLQRILLFLNPQIGQSVERVYALADLYNEISIQAARHLVAIWCEADPLRPEASAVTRPHDRESAGLLDPRPRQSTGPDQSAARGSDALRSLPPLRAAPS
jgi:hypothetical protein